MPLIGYDQLVALGNRLEEKIGKTWRLVNREESYTGGVGGKCKIIGVVEIPLGIAGESGIKTMKVTEANVPPLIGGDFMEWAC